MSTNKFHVSTKTGKIKECGAVKRACQYAQHYGSEKEAAASIVNSRLSPSVTIEGITKPPIIVEPIAFKEPSEYFSSEYEYDYDSYSPDYYFGNDYYGDSDDYYDSSEPDRYSVYENLRLTSVDAEATVRSMLGVYDSNVPLPQSLQELITENHWDTVDSWEISAERDYYGETAVVTIPSNMQAKVSEWYWSQPNAVDKTGVLDYVRSKGTVTEGLKPLDALKAQLREENNGRRNRLVENAKKVTKVKVDLNRIDVPHPDRLDAVAPRIPVNANNQPGIAGVLIKEGRRYRLVDGYHRLKFFKTTNRLQGRYLVLS